MLGAHLQVEEGEDVAAVAIEVARALGTTYVLIGTPARRNGISRLLGGASLLSRLLEGLPGVDIRIVADPSVRRPPDQELLKTGGVPGTAAEGDVD
jgi:K+-sensing histidine kinase KdpD